MKIEIYYEGELEVFDTLNFTEAQPFTGVNMLSDFILNYGKAETEGIFLDAHCYVTNAGKQDDDGTPIGARMQGYRFKLVGQNEAARMTRLCVDGETVLIRIGNDLCDVLKLNSIADNCVGITASPTFQRILETRTYLSNAHDDIASNPQAMAETLGLTPESLDYVIECKSRQAQFEETNDEDWMCDGNA